MGKIKILIAKRQKYMRVMIGVLRFILMVEIIFMLAINVWFLLCHYVWDKNPPEFLGYVPAVIQDISMQPQYSRDDTMILRQKEEYQMGEIVGFYRDGKLIIHRIIGIHQGDWITKGDANPQADDTLLTTSEIIGGAVLHIPFSGKFINWLKRPVATVILTTVSVIFIIIPAALDKREKNKMRLTQLEDE